MTKTKMIWALALGLLLPVAAQAQQNPTMVAKGAQVYSANCGRCHTARASTERTDGEWVVIVMHMRARANLTKAQADAVLAYLQATNGSEGSAGGGSEDAQTTAVNRPVPAPRVVIPEGLRALLVREAMRVTPKGTDRGEDPAGH